MADPGAAERAPSRGTLNQVLASWLGDGNALEDPLESGGYEYRCNGERQPIVETWSAFQVAPGQQIVCSERYVPEAKLSISSIARLTEQKVQAMYTQLHRESAHRTVSLYCDLSDSILFTERFVNGKTGGERRMEVGSGVLLYPLMRIYLGGVIRQIIDLGGAASVVTPDITSPDDEQRLLQPRISARSAKELDSDSVGSARCFQFLGEQYDESAVFWLDDWDRLVRYDWPQRNPESGAVQSWEIVSV